MIYNYECAVLRKINSIIPEIRDAVYAPNDVFFNSLDRAKKFPCFYYNRTSTVWTWDKPIYSPDFESRREYYMYPFQQTYEGHILVENQATAFKLASHLKFRWGKTPYVEVRVPVLGSEVFIRVALRLTSISVTDVRLPDDKLGAARLVSFTWQSNLCLFYSPQDDGKPAYTLVERVRVYLDDQHNTVLQILTDTEKPVEQRINEVAPNLIFEVPQP